MKPATLMQVLVLVAIVLSSSIVMAEESRQVMNGATCTGNPPYTMSLSVWPFEFFLYGFGGDAFCQITMPDGWSTRDLSYVLITGSAEDNNEVKIRLCVAKNHTSRETACGNQRTLTGDPAVQWVAPPSPMPSSASGAYVRITFPNNKTSTIRNINVNWKK